MEKTWIDWSEDCPNCGDGVSVLTDAVQDATFPQAYDGDKAKCNSCEWEGYVNVDSDDEGIGSASLKDDED